MIERFDRFVPYRLGALERNLARNVEPFWRFGRLGEISLSGGVSSTSLSKEFAIGYLICLSLRISCLGAVIATIVIALGKIREEVCSESDQSMSSKQIAIGLSGADPDADFRRI